MDKLKMQILEMKNNYDRLIWQEFVDWLKAEVDYEEENLCDMCSESDHQCFNLDCEDRIL